jgi:hypothetical protein
MRNKVLIFVLANFLFAALAISIYAIGYEYDKTNKLFPESKRVSYDLSLQVYGKRWVRFVEWTLGLGFLANSVILMIWYRNRQKGAEAGITEGNSL